MESYIVNSSVQELKSNLSRFILSQSNGESEKIMFSKSVLFMHKNNPDMVCSVYGIDKGLLLFDTLHTGVETIELTELPIETMIKVKEQMEYHFKNKQYSRG